MFAPHYKNAHFWIQILYLMAYFFEKPTYNIQRYCFI